MSLIDLFKEFHSRAIVDAYPLSARALFDTLLFDFNAAFWPEERVYSQRELGRLTGLPTTTVHRAMKFLSDRGHIKTHSTKRGTVVKLAEHRRNTNGTPAEHPRNTGGTPAASSNIRVREDVKTLDVKILKEEEEEARAGACVNRNSKIAEFSPTPDTENASLTIHDIWEYETGFKLTGSVAYQLEELANDDFALVHKAIIKAVESKTTDRLRYNYFKKIFDGMKNPKPKGGEKREYDSARILGYTDDDAPDVSWIYEAQNANGTGNRLH